MVIIRDIVAYRDTEGSFDREPGWVSCSHSEAKEPFVLVVQNGGRPEGPIGINSKQSFIQSGSILVNQGKGMRIIQVGVEYDNVPHKGTRLLVFENEYLVQSKIGWCSGCCIVVI